MPTLTSQLRSTIKRSKLSTHALGKQSGVSQQVIHRFVTKRRSNLRLDTVDKLARYFSMKFTAPKFRKVKR